MSDCDYSDLVSALQFAAPITHAANSAYGALAQAGVAHEELGELTAAINRWHRGRVDFDQVEEEIADVLVVITGLLAHGGSGSADRVARMVREKSDRLAKRMEPSKDARVPPAPKSLTTMKALERAEPGVDGAFDFWR